MKRNITSFFVLLTLLLSGFSTAQATVLPFMPYYYPSVPVISGVSGPQTLNVGQTGTWRVSAYDQAQSNLSYFVDWGEKVTMKELNSYSGSAIPEQESSFSHIYNQAGNYTVTFNVTNDYGQSATTSLSVKVKGDTIMPSLKVLSPNGGETWVKNTTKTIRWNQNTIRYSCSEGMYCPDYFSPRYDISLINYYPPCLDNICPLSAMAPKMIAKGVYGSSYQWNVGRILDENEKVRDGSFRIVVCETGSGVCDSSDNYFKIISPNIVNPVIAGITGPKSLKVGQTGTWTVKVKNPIEGNLSYSVDWGDSIAPSYFKEGGTGSVQVINQTATFSHNYVRPGNYTIRFTVTNNDGQSVSKNFKVKVRQIDIWTSVSNR